jgi:hypothetical protein
MKLRVALALTLALATAAVAAASVGAAMIGIYRNGMETTAQRAQLVKLSGGSCTRGGSDGALRVAIGKRTDACSYRTPVLGRDLEISATERLLSGTPTAARHKAYLALELRAGGGAKYQLLVFPLQRKAQLVKVTGAGAEFLAIEKSLKTVVGVNRANSLKLRAINVRSGADRGRCKLFAYVGGALVAEATDEAAGELSGRAAAVAVGATKSANGIIGSIDDVVVRVPSPF